MAGVKFDIDESSALAKYLRAGFDRAARRAVLGAAMKAVQYITTDIIPAEPRQPVDRGMYRAGWRAKATPQGAEVVNTLPYASIIEYGARAENIKVGRKMIEALASWVERKGLNTDTPGGATGVAWAIAMSMKRRGIFNGGKGLRVLEKATKKIPSFVREEIAREMKKEFK